MILFLDFDGVLHPHPHPHPHPNDGTQFSNAPRVWELLARHPEASIVFSTGWRFEHPVDSLRGFATAQGGEHLADRFIDATPLLRHDAEADRPEGWVDADRDKLVATDSSLGLSAPSARVRLAAALGNTAHAWAVADTMADLLTLPRVERSETFADLVRWVEWWECSYLTAVTLEPSEVARLKAGRWWPPVVSTKQISDMPPAIARRRIP